MSHPPQLRAFPAGSGWVLEDSSGNEPTLAQARMWLEERIAKNALQLPLVAESSAQLLAMTRNDDCSIQDLVDVVQRDPPLAAHLLRVTNSPYYAPKYPATTIRQAVTRLGLSELRRVSILLSCQTRIFRVTGWEDEVAELFSHSLTTALYSIEIAKRVRADEEEAFLCGLLHDVGHAIVLQGLADFEEEVRTQVPREWLVELAREYHTDVGGKLAFRWGLSARVAEVVASHHRVLKAPSTALALAHLADTLAYGAPGTLEALQGDPMLVPLGLDEKALEDLFNQRRQVVALAALMI